MFKIKEFFNFNELSNNAKIEHYWEMASNQAHSYLIRQGVGKGKRLGELDLDPTLKSILGELDNAYETYEKERIQTAFWKSFNGSFPNDVTKNNIDVALSKNKTNIIRNFIRPEEKKIIDEYEENEEWDFLIETLSDQAKAFQKNALKKD